MPRLVIGFDVPMLVRAARRIVVTVESTDMEGLGKLPGAYLWSAVAFDVLTARADTLDEIREEVGRDMRHELGAPCMVGLDLEGFVEQERLAPSFILEK